MTSRRKQLVGLLGAAGLVALGWALLQRPWRSRALAATMGSSARAASTGWPSPDAPLTPPAVVFPPGFGVHRIYVDAGHGAPGNTGNTSSFCVDEQDFTLAVARALADYLEATGHFEARVSRQSDQRIEYLDRVDDAARWGAEVFLSLHSDARGKPERWWPEPGLSCPRSLGAPGFSVLLSDEGEPAMNERRVTLARAVARRIQGVGITAYAGAEYQGLYEGDARQPGVFLDRHALDQRIFVLRRPVMPSILIETHNALDPREAERWNEERTRDAFSAAVTAGLVDALDQAADPAKARGHESDAPPDG